jgi:UDP-3-O-[3-hydroxymyristoyl] glucosamine N-acyltransferase
VIQEWTTGEIAQAIDARCDGDEHRILTGLDTLEGACPQDLSFCAKPQYFERLERSRAGAVVVKEGVDVPAGMVEPAVEEGVHPLAYVAPGATVEGSRVGPFAVVESGASVGPGAEVMAHAYVGKGVEIGEGARVMPHAVVMEGCVIEARVTVQPGAVIGSPGFGVVRGEHGVTGVPQVGGVRVEEGASVGANTCVDRGALTETRIGRGTHIDNLCQVAHGVKVGEESLLAAFTGLAGSALVGDRVSFGGRASVGEGTQVGDDARLAACTGAFRDVEASQEVGGFPARAQRRWLREMASLTHLPAMIRGWRKGDAER